MSAHKSLSAEILRWLCTIETVYCRSVAGHPEMIYSSFLEDLYLLPYRTVLLSVGAENNNGRRNTDGNTWRGPRCPRNASSHLLSKIYP